VGKGTLRELAERFNVSCAEASAVPAASFKRFSRDLSKIVKEGEGDHDRTKIPDEASEPAAWR